MIWWIVIAVALLALGHLLLWVLFVLQVKRIDRLTIGQPGCSHPDVKNVGTFGHPEYECTFCHQTVDLP